MPYAGVFLSLEQANIISEAVDNPYHTNVQTSITIINTSYQKLPFGSGDYPDKLLLEVYQQALILSF